MRIILCYNKEYDSVYPAPPTSKTSMN